MGFTRSLKRAHTIRLRFGKGPIVIPVVVVNAARGDDDARAVGSTHAVHEHRAGTGVFQQLYFAAWRLCERLFILS